MSSEKHRLLERTRRGELQADEVGRHRGSYLDFIRRVRRRAAKQSRKGRAGIREDARYFMQWIRSERTLCVAWDYLSKHGGETPGIDDLRYCDVPETQLWRSLREVRDEIRRGEYKPAPDRVVQVSKGPGRGTRSVSIPCIHDRAVQRAIVEVLQPYLDPLFDPHSFAYRPRRGVLDALAHAGHYFRSEGRGVWVTADLANAFGRVPIPRLVQVAKHYLFADDVVEFIGRVLGGAQQPGLRQGSPASPLLLNLYLHYVLDRKWRLLHPDIPLLRYADDILLMCRTVVEARQAHDDLVELLQPAGMLVKGDRRGDVVTLTPDNSAQWLGFRFEKRDAKNLAVLIADKSWASLAENLDEAHDAPNAPLSAWLTIKGWVADKGPSFKHTNPDEAWDRIVNIARPLAFDEIPDRQRVREWWQRAYARWCRLRKQYRRGGQQKTASASARR